MALPEKYQDFQITLHNRSGPVDLPMSRKALAVLVGEECAKTLADDATLGKVWWAFLAAQRLYFPSTASTPSLRTPQSSPQLFESTDINHQISNHTSGSYLQDIARYHLTVGILNNHNPTIIIRSMPRYFILVTFQTRKTWAPIPSNANLKLLGHYHCCRPVLHGPLRGNRYWL